MIPILFSRGNVAAIVNIKLNSIFSLKRIRISDLSVSLLKDSVFSDDHSLAIETYMYFYFAEHTLVSGYLARCEMSRSLYFAFYCAPN